MTPMESAGANSRQGGGRFWQRGPTDQRRHQGLPANPWGREVGTRSSGDVELPSWAGAMGRTPVDKWLAGKGYGPKWIADFPHSFPFSFFILFFQIQKVQLNLNC
jgi:hypothetical protein